MREGATEFWAAVMFGGPASGSGSQVERVEYDPDWLRGMVESGRVRGVD